MSLFTNLFESEDEMLVSATRVCSEVQRFVTGLPLKKTLMGTRKTIYIRLEPEIVYGGCHGIVITDLYADTPGQGVGTQVMKYLLNLADAEGLNVYVDAEGKRSYGFYVKFGFERMRSQRHQLVHYAPQPDFESDI